MAKESLRSQVATLRELREGDRRQYDNMSAILSDTKQRMKELTEVNESLRADKRWLQQMHSAVLQSMHEFTKGRH